MTDCSVNDCYRPLWASSTGLCSVHGRRQERYGDALAYLPVRNCGKFFQPRLPLAPLRALAPSTSRLAEWIGASYRQVTRWKAGGITLDFAETACDALGVHPTELWGDDYAFVASCPLAIVAAQLCRTDPPRACEVMTP